MSGKFEKNLKNFNMSNDSSSTQTQADSPLPAISGFLLKKSTNGEWQKRYFETNGSFLTYYKSQKMTKLLAALSLPQVGGITLIGETNDGKDGAIFQLDLKDRQYILRATTLAEAQNWVNVLIQLRDANLKKSPTSEKAAPAVIPYAPPGPRDPPPPGLKENTGSGSFVKEPRPMGLSFSSCCVIA